MFHAGVASTDQDSVLAEVAQWEGVIHSGRLDPDAVSEPVNRMAYVVLTPTSDPETIVERLRGLDEIESAQLATPRYAV
jgi:hypothetical protein